MLDPNTLILEYCYNNLSILKISKKYRISTKRISKQIDLLEIPKKKKNNNLGRILSSSTKDKISNSIKNLESHPSGWKRSHVNNCTNIRINFKLDESVDLSKYENYGKLKKITSFLSKNIKKETKNPTYIINFIEYFYNDVQFNQIYDTWFKNKNKWSQPSLDHKTPISKGGSDDLLNLQVLTWFENRSKINFTQEEWEEFKKKTGTSSDLFYEY
jgi:hypothetical protein